MLDVNDDGNLTSVVFTFSCIPEVLTGLYQL